MALLIVPTKDSALMLCKGVGMVLGTIRLRCGYMRHSNGGEACGTIFAYLLQHFRVVLKLLEIATQYFWSKEQLGCVVTACKGFATVFPHSTEHSASTVGL